MPDKKDAGMVDQEELQNKIMEIYRRQMDLTDLGAGDSAMVEWLQAAIPDLDDQDLERVCVELITHYQDALETARETGATQSEAELQALEELGEAETTRRNLSRTYPNSRERDKLRRLKDQYNLLYRPKFLICAFVWLCVFTGVVIAMLAFRPDALIAYFGLFALVFAPLQSVGHTFVRAYLIVNRRSRAPVLRYVVTTIIFWMVIGIIPDCIRIFILVLDKHNPGKTFFLIQPPGLELLLFAVFLLPFALLYILLDLPLLRKLQRWKDEIKKPGPDQYA